MGTRIIVGCEQGTDVEVGVFYNSTTGVPFGFTISEYEGQNNHFDGGEFAALFDNWCSVKCSIHLHRVDYNDFANLFSDFCGECHAIDERGEDINDYMAQGWKPQEEWDDE
jgi:hypothetical protein